MKLEKAIKQVKFKNEYQKAIINILYTSNWLYYQHSEHLKPYKLTVQQFNILRILRGQFPKPASIKLIKERMLDKMSDASRIVEKLRLKNLVTRKSSKSDRRNVEIVITNKGLEILKKLDSLDELIKEKYSALISLKEAKVLNSLLDKIRD